MNSFNRLIRSSSYDAVDGVDKSYHSSVMMTLEEEIENEISAIKSGLPLTYKPMKAQVQPAAGPAAVMLRQQKASPQSDNRVMVVKSDGKQESLILAHKSLPISRGPQPNYSILQKAANEARGLSMDAVHKCSSGHLGLPLGCAEIGAILFGQELRYNPLEPKWINRDRFVLSAGHGSMFLYGWLHLSGYKVSLDDVKNFRVFGSITPGHPEFRETPGVEATTGPLGQGISNAVGYALSQKMAAQRWNTPAHQIFKNHIFCLCGDGCMQEGVAMEAASFAGHQRLDNLILIYDSNEVTLDAMADASQSEDTGKRFEAMGWSVTSIDGHNMAAIWNVLKEARNSTGKPQLIIAKTLIGKGIPEVAGTQKAHGEAGTKFVAQAKANLGLPESSFYVSDETRAYFRDHSSRQQAAYSNWLEMYEAWRRVNPALAADLDIALKGGGPADLLDSIPQFPVDAKIATRKAGGDVIQAVANKVPHLITGSADLFGSTLNYIASSKDFTPSSLNGRNIRFGIREHGMCGIMNGIAYDGFFRPSGATFLVFADYCRASIRVAALSHLPCLYIFTHDSAGVGEDGPTHQPVETVTSLRVIPNLDVIRPADPEETAGAYAAAILRTDGPTLFSLSRQATRNLSEIPSSVRRQGVFFGAYIAIKETSALKCIILATGTEVAIAIAAAKELGPNVRVVSVPSMFRFDKQSQSYQNEVLPNSCLGRVAIEAGVSGLWWKYVGLHGKVIGIDRFGLSAPGDKVLASLGINSQSVIDAARSFL